MPVELDKRLVDLDKTVRCAGEHRRRNPACLAAVAAVATDAIVSSVTAFTCALADGQPRPRGPGQRALPLSHPIIHPIDGTYLHVRDEP
jgi:hypothetical protein